MESHGSLISHLLSQVRLGMDLTKVVLPTFILEKRSLLEMYADFIAHPDIFVGSVAFSTSCARIKVCGILLIDSYLVTKMKEYRSLLVSSQYYKLSLYLATDKKMLSYALANSPF